MEKKGFYKSTHKLGLRLLVALLIFAILMYFPFLYDKVTENGTSVQFIWACIVIMLAPIVGLIDAVNTEEKK